MKYTYIFLESEKYSENKQSRLSHFKKMRSTLVQTISNFYSFIIKLNMFSKRNLLIKVTTKPKDYLIYKKIGSLELLANKKYYIQKLDWTQRFPLPTFKRSYSLYIY